MKYVCFGIERQKYQRNKKSDSAAHTFFFLLCGNEEKKPIVVDTFCGFFNITFFKTYEYDPLSIILLLLDKYCVLFFPHIYTPLPCSIDRFMCFVAIHTSDTALSALSIFKMQPQAEKTGKVVSRRSKCIIKNLYNAIKTHLTRILRCRALHIYIYIIYKNDRIPNQTRICASAASAASNSIHRGCSLA